MWSFRNSHKKESALLHTYLMIKYLTACSSRSTKHFWKKPYKDTVLPRLVRMHTIKWQFFSKVTRCRNLTSPISVQFGHGLDSWPKKGLHPKGFWPRSINDQDMAILNFFIDFQFFYQENDFWSPDHIFWPRMMKFGYVMPKDTRIGI